MKYKSKLLIILCLLLASLSGCKKKNDPEPIPDTTKPAITLANPTAGQSFVPGNTIPFKATFSDNDLLKNYEIAISKAATSGLILKIVPTSVPFSYVKSSTNFTAGVKQQEIILSDILIPANSATTITTPGKYNFKVTCVDGSNNSTVTTVEININ